jgi:hypothetical protein
MSRSHPIHVAVRTLDEQYEQDILDARAQYQRAKFILIPAVFGIPLLMWSITNTFSGVVYGLIGGIIAGFGMLFYSKFALKEAEDNYQAKLDLKREYHR